MSANNLTSDLKEDSKEARATTASVRGFFPAHTVAAGALLLIFLSLCLGISFSYSPTYDELKFLKIGEELASGAGWQTEMSVVHAPLSFYTHGFLLKPFHFSDEVERLHWARVTMLVYALALGLLVYIWAARLFSPKGGLVALALYVFNPNVLAHSSLITTDVIYACFSFFLLYFFWRYITEGRSRWIFASGISFGLALLSKYSAVFWFFLIPLLSLILIGFRSLRSSAEQKIMPVHMSRLLLAVVSILVIGMLVLNVGYGFSGSFFLLGEHHYQSNLLAKLSQNAFASRIPVPAPYPFVRGYDAQKYISEVGHPSFLAGMRSTTGWWYYYPLAFLLKMPVFFWPLLLAAAAAILKATRRQKLGAVLFLATALTIVVAFSLVSRSQAGFRYALVALPPLFVFAGASVDFGPQRWRKIAVAGLMVLYVAPALWTYPHELAYFSAIVGGPKNGYKWLSDSNLDWGQDLDLARRYVAHAKTPVTVNPGILPVPGRILINATSLQDCFSTYDIHGWLRGFKPIGNIGYSWLLFDLDNNQVSSRAASEKAQLPDEYFSAAFAYARNRLRDAEKLSREALNVHPQLSEAYYLLGLSQLGLGKLKDAAASFSEIPEAHPLYVDARSNLSFIAALGGDTEASLQYQKQANIEETLRAYAKRPELSGTDDSSAENNSWKFHNNRGVSLWARGDLAGAEKDIRKALEIQPDFAEGLANLAVILEERGATDDAVKTVDQYYRDYLLLKCSPFRDYRVYYEGNVVMLGDTLEIYPKPDVDVLRLKYHLSVYPKDSAALNQLAVLLIKRGSFGEAYECLNRAISMGGTGLSATYTNLAVLYTEKKMLLPAAQACRQALEMEPGNSAAAKLLTSLQRTEEAAENQ